METKLFKRNANNNIIQWSITENNNKEIVITHGIYGKQLHIETIIPSMKKANEIQSRIAAKRKEGYKALEDLYDNAPRSISIENEYNYLNTYLPKYNTTGDDFVLPMLAKTLEDNTPFEKFGTMLGQWKINGLRCLIGAKKVEDDLFNPIQLTYTSREGTKWNLSWMDEIILPKISKTLLDVMIDEGAYLDGELYLPGYSVNDINSFVKNNTLPQHYKLQYWCYDIAIEGYTTISRNKIIYNNINTNSAIFATKNEHLNNTKQFVLLPTMMVENIEEATQTRNENIDLGFEGLILRNPYVEYAFGKRNNSMFKYKKKEDGIFDIVRIEEDKRGLPIYVLKNDINDEQFECTLNAPQNIQKNHIQIKDMLIGKQGLVEYRERSGVKQVPFHAKLIKIIL